MKRGYVLLVAALAMMLTAAAADAQELCDCDWEALAAVHPEEGDLAELIDWTTLDDPSPITGTIAVGETVTLASPGYEDLVHIADGDCEYTLDETGFWASWDESDPLDVTIPSDFFFEANAETIEERHFGLYAQFPEDWPVGEGVAFLLCPAAAEPEAAIAYISGPHLVTEGQEVTLVGNVLGGEGDPTGCGWTKDSSPIGDPGDELDLGAVDAGDEGVYVFECTVDDAPATSEDFELMLVDAVPLAGGLGLGLLAGACALAGAVTIRRKK